MPKDGAGGALASTTGDGVAESDEDVASTKELAAIHDAMVLALDDRELLESYAQGENRQIADAVKMALEKMDGRN